MAHPCRFRENSTTDPRSRCRRSKLAAFHFSDLDYLQSSRMVLVIDNYDSFTYNLVRYLGEMQVKMEVHRNDQISIDQIRALNPERILISPGPCSPKESGLSNEIIKTFSSQVPTL